MGARQAREFRPCTLHFRHYPSPCRMRGRGGAWFCHGNTTGDHEQLSAFCENANSLLRHVACNRRNCSICMGRRVGFVANGLEPFGIHRPDQWNTNTSGKFLLRSAGHGLIHASTNRQATVKPCGGGVDASTADHEWCNPLRTSGRGVLNDFDSHRWDDTLHVGCKFWGFTARP